MSDPLAENLGENDIFYPEFKPRHGYAKSLEKRVRNMWLLHKRMVVRLAMAATNYRNEV
jgi:hypothetical protein